MWRDLAPRHKIHFLDMKALQTIAGFGRLYGGIATCTYDLITAMHGIGFPLDLLTLQIKNPADKLMGRGETWIKALPNDAVTPYSSFGFRNGYEIIA